MKLKILTIDFKKTETFIKDIDNVLFDRKNQKRNKGKSISFDSVETFKKIMTYNKIQILMAISRLRPESINQLANFLGREYPHVHKDCKSLEALGFINLEEQAGPKKQFWPKLSFSYDIIRVKTSIEEIYSISDESNRVLLEYEKVS
jgi:predicted transcriptional regulator